MFFFIVLVSEQQRSRCRHCICGIALPLHKIGPNYKNEYFLQNIVFVFYFVLLSFSTPKPSWFMVSSLIAVPPS